MVLLGFDIGSSSIKATILESETGNVLASAMSPETELAISAPRPEWAEQDPNIWWEHVKTATANILEQSKIDKQDIKAIGISYQMHGLVLVDENQNILRPSIIWCDSRAVSIGNKAFRDLGREYCLKNYLNSPGNFTASKLRWVKENEPDLFDRIDKMMLPGEYIAMKLTGEIKTTPSGLSEAILWNFQTQSLAEDLLDYFEIPQDRIPAVVPTFSVQGKLSPSAAKELGLIPGTGITYRAGDQPNNALSLNVLNPGELAATAGTSGVVYGISDRPIYDPKSRVNTFVHVNHTKEAPRNGVLLCVNGTGKLNSWLKIHVADRMDYNQMNHLASQSPVGARGLVVLPFGNGAERILENRNIGSSIHQLNFNTHTVSDLLRASQESIVFALNYGIEIMREMGLTIQTIRAGHTNMFLSPLFTEAFATISGAAIELFNTDGSQGAARGAGIGAGIYKNAAEAFVGLKSVKVIEPNRSLESAYRKAYDRWLNTLQDRMNKED
ncbi:carbohydrate kinase [bacterium]|nr:carbohydrate kinase [bacterium]